MRLSNVCFPWMWFISISVSGRKECVYTVSLNIFVSLLSRRRTIGGGGVSHVKWFTLSTATGDRVSIQHHQWRVKIHSVNISDIDNNECCHHSSPHQQACYRYAGLDRKYFGIRIMFPTILQGCDKQRQESITMDMLEVTIDIIPPSPTSKTPFILWLLSIRKLQSQSQSLNSILKYLFSWSVTSEVS